MSLHNWFLSQQNAYWLVSSETHKKAIKQNHQLGFSDALPLFYGESFHSVMDYSPWLIPVQSAFNNIEANTFEQGLVFVSSSSIWDVIEHLRTLLFAALEGEEVLFRFYDTKVLVPMLATFHQDEINVFLGNCQSISCVEGGILKQYTNLSQLEYKPKTSSWWRILPHHLAPLYNVKTHAQIIVNRLWEKLPRQTDLLSEPVVFFQHYLSQAIELGFSSDKAEGIALVEFSKQTNTSYQFLSQALLLTDDELDELQKIEKEWQKWEC